jgi:hypothetical protein
MKTIILFIALTGFTAVGSYAQNKNCSCKLHHNAVSERTAYKPPTIVPRVPVDPDTQSPTCFMMKKENIGIPGCVDVNYSGDDTYFGYYPNQKVTTPKKVQSHKIMKMKEAVITTPIPVPQPAPVYIKAEEPVVPCYTYRQHNIVVKECPGDFYGSDGRAVSSASMDVNTSNTYMGNYPKTDNNVEPAVPENTDDDEYRTKSPGDNLCFWNCK